MKHLLLAATVLIALLWANAGLCLIDINSASQKELENLPAIGPVTAERIIEGRPYRSVNDLTRVKGIGKKTLDKIKHLIVAGEAKLEEKEAPAEAEEREPIEVPVYSVENYRLLRCYKCKNQFKVSDELKSGWCPYCNSKWYVSKDAPTPPAPSAGAEAAPGVISFEDAGDYMGQTKSVEGTVVGTHLSSRSGNLYMNFHQDYRTYLSVKIPASDLSKFKPDAATYYKGKKIIATGKIIKDRAYLRIEVTDPADLKVVE